MKRLFPRVLLVMAALMGLSGAARAQAFLEQEWLLNTKASRIYMNTVKANALFETHHFSSIDGTIKPSGEASVRIELASLDTGIDLRDVRMRFLLFETFKFPYAEITAKLDKNRLRDLATKTRIAYPLRFTLDLHGVRREMDTVVWVTRISDTALTVSTVQPIVVNADDFELGPNVAKLVDAVNGTLIAPAASITFDLMFGSGELMPQLESERNEALKRSKQDANAMMDAEACETRFSVISRTGALHFKPGSAELDRNESDPLLGAISDFALRCPGIRIEIGGHTDSDGSRDANMRLSEQRAKAVLADLARRGVDVTRIRSEGFGPTRPIAANDSPANKAKNRRIEFVVTKM